MSPSAWIAFKALNQLGIQPVLLNAIYRLGLASGHYRRVESRDKRVENSSLRPLFVFPKQDELLAVIGGDEGRSTLLAEADEIVAGKLRLFGAEPVELQLSFPGPLVHWTAYERDPSLLSVHSSLFSDIKFFWEPVRFGWAFTLGRAFHLTRDEKYAESFWHAFETFTAANPPYLGPHWTSSQEVALRLMAFVWTGQVFGGSSSSTPERNAALAEAVAVHALRIPPTLVYARSQQNNHLLTEAAGLLTAGLALPDHPEASRWRALGWKNLNAGLQSQIDSSGEYAQHSTNYHRLMLQVVLWTNAIIRSNDFSRSGNNDFSRSYWPPQTHAAIQRSIHWLLSLLDPDSGRTPNLGANDGAYIFPLTTCPFSDFRPVAHAASRAFLNNDLPGGSWDELALWFGLPLESTLAKVRQPPDEFLKPKSRCQVKASHDYNLRKADRINGKDSWAYLRIAKFTNRPSHADQLHVDLWWRGLNLARDAGTYRYNAAWPWENSLTSALVHNTVTVDGRDQFTRAGRFLYLDWFNAFQSGGLEGGPSILQCMRAWHTGFRKHDIRHERTVTAYADGRWQIRDELLSVRMQRVRKQHTFRLHWLLPDWEWRVESSHNGIVLRLVSPYGPIDLRLAVTDGEVARVDLVRAGEVVHASAPGDHIPPLEMAIRGWVSPTYGLKVPALSMAVETISANDVQFVSEFIFPS